MAAMPRVSMRRLRRPGSISTTFAPATWRWSSTSSGAPSMSSGPASARA